MPLRDAVNDWLKGSAAARRLRLSYLRAARELDRRTVKPMTLNLALQGGGVLGAFTWGVLDRLSHERTLDVKAISGASAGARLFLAAHIAVTVHPVDVFARAGRGSLAIGAAAPA